MDKDKKDEIIKICLNTIKDLLELEVGVGKVDINNSEMLNSEEIDEFGKMNLEVRQLAILEKIKQFSVENGEGCGLKELMTAFPDITDRTLRYDLQKLALNGSIIKIGNRGPNTIYKPAKSV